MDQQKNRETAQAKLKREWEPMRLTYVGQVAQIVQQGGGKLSVPGGDPGEPRKPRGLD